MANDGRELDGRAAIVTGSAQNMGRVIAKTLAEAGAAVVINARNSKAASEAVAGEIEAAGGRAIVHMADVTVPDQAAGLIDAAVAAFGRLDILVNNVSIRIARPVTETSFEDWRMVTSSTLDGAFLCAKAAIPHLAKNGVGTIVNMGGVSGHAGVANRSAVAAAKAGLAGFTGSLGAELAPQDITVNCVSPGHIDRATAPGEISQHFVDRAIPAGRAGQPEEVAAMVRLLCGPGGRYVTGQTIQVNGGWHISLG
jgi:3-oxoacyl-[acyl-carrier protein] reductase